MKYLKKSNATWLFAIVFLCIAVHVAMSPLIYYEFNERVRTDTSFKEKMETAHTALFALPLLGILFLYPLMEEVIFRGSVYVLVKRKKSKRVIYAAIFITAAMFAGVHFINGGAYTLISVLSVLFIRGVLFGILILKTESLLLAVMAHSLTNLFECL